MFVSLIICYSLYLTFLVLKLYRLPLTNFNRSYCSWQGNVFIWEDNFPVGIQPKVTHRKLLSGKFVSKADRGDFWSRWLSENDTNTHALSRTNTVPYIPPYTIPHPIVYHCPSSVYMKVLPYWCMRTTTDSYCYIMSFGFQLSLILCA